jgi:hypothetical protein
VDFDTKVAVVLRDDLAVWQKANVTAFLVSGIVAATEGITGPDYEDGSGNKYLPMIVQPVQVFESDAAGLKRAWERALARGVKPAPVARHGHCPAFPPHSGENRTQLGGA